MKTGIELIAQEQHDQIEKHKRSIEDDVKYNNQHQLTLAASYLCLPDTGYDEPEDFCETHLAGRRT